MSLGERRLDEVEPVAADALSVGELRPVLLKSRLAEELDLEPEAFDGLDPEVLARLLRAVRGVARPGAGGRAARPGAPPTYHDPELVSRVLRTELAERLQIDPAPLAAVGPLAAAALLERFAGAQGRPPRRFVDEARGRDPERRDIVSRALREELARELGIAAPALAAVSPDVVVLAVHRLGAMAGQVTGGRPQMAERAGEERREPVGRRVRQELADRLGLPAAELSGLSVPATALLLRRFQEEARRARELERMARTDPLTGVLRREPGLDSLRVEIGRARRLSDFRFVVAFLHLEGLEAVIAAEGHERGDQVVQELSRAVVGRLRGHDLVIRWGAGELVCAMPQSDLESARSVFEQIQGIFEPAAASCRLTVGLATLAEGDTAVDLVARANEDRRQAARKPPT